MSMDKIQGNEFVINLHPSQYDHGRDYWQEVAWQRAKATNRAVVITVNSEVRYRAWPERESAYKGSDDQ